MISEVTETPAATQCHGPTTTARARFFRIFVEP